MSRNAERKRRRRERRARINLKHDETQAVIDKPDADNESANSEPKKDSCGISTPTPAATSQPKKQNPAEDAKRTSKIMRPLVAMWRGIIFLGNRSARGFNFLNSHSGAITAIATVVIAALTFIYAWYSRRQWQVAQDTLQVGQRAYITVGRKDGTIAEFIPSKDPKQKAELVLYFQNSGRLPAKLNWGASLAIPDNFTKDSKPIGLTLIHPFKLMGRARDKKTGSISGQEADATIAGDSIFGGVVGEIEQDRLPEFSVDADIMIIGSFEYCDELGTESMHQFSIHTRNSQNTSVGFSLLGDSEVSFILHESRPPR